MMEVEIHNMIFNVSKYSIVGDKLNCEIVIKGSGLNKIKIAWGVLFNNEFHLKDVSLTGFE